MSSHLKEKSFVLGINARSLASQSAERLSHSKKVQSMQGNDDVTALSKLNFKSEYVLN